MTDEEVDPPLTPQLTTQGTMHGITAVHAAMRGGRDGCGWHAAKMASGAVEVHDGKGN